MTNTLTADTTEFIAAYVALVADPSDEDWDMFLVEADDLACMFDADGINFAMLNTLQLLALNRF